MKRANTYYDVIYNFNKEIAQARQSNDTARVEELSKHLGMLLDDGLAPTLIKARTLVEGGTGVEEYLKFRGRVALGRRVARHPRGQSGGKGFA